MASLRGARGAGPSALIAVLADPQRAAEYPAVRSALVAMRGDAIAPLADIIEHAEPELMVQAITALAQMRATESIVYLFVPAWPTRATCGSAAREAIVQLMGQLPSKEQAVRQLTNLARSYFAGKQPLRVDVDGRVTLWSWDPASKQCTSRNCTPEDAARAIAARLARAAQSLAPKDHHVQMLALATALEQAAYDRGLDKPLDVKDPLVHQIAALDPRTLNDVLSFCEAEGHPRPAGGGRNPRQPREIDGFAARRKRSVALVRAVRAPIGGCGLPPWKRSPP